MKRKITAFLAAFGMTVTLAASGALVHAENPIVQTSFTPDPAPVVFGDELWVFTGCDRNGENDFYKMTGWQCFSTKDMKNWTDHGRILEDTSFSWCGENDAWASQCIERNGKYYLYYSGDEGRQKAIGVAVADSPTGPFHDFGKPIVNKRPEGVKNGQQIDVDVFLDDDGQAYLYWGNGYMAGAKLNEDMTSIDTTTVTVMTPRGGTLRDYAFREGAYVFKRNGLYYFLWSVDDTGSPNYHVAYGTSRSPLGPIEVAAQPVILQQRPDENIFGTAHNSVVQLPGRDEWYVIYHRINPTFMDRNLGPGFHRQVCIDRMEFNPDGTIRPVTPTQTGVKPVKVKTKKRK